LLTNGCKVSIIYLYLEKRKTKRGQPRWDEAKRHPTFQEKNQNSS